MEGAVSYSSLPKMLDKDDFNRWARGLDNLENWVQVELDELEQVYIAEVNLSAARRFRMDFFKRFGFKRLPGDHERR